MNNRTKEDIIEEVREREVEFIRLQFTDIFGNFKNVAITARQLEKALNNDCMFDFSAIEGFYRDDEGEMRLKPDFSTFTVFPWRPQGSVARLICDVCTPDGKPFEADPRYLLKKTIAKANQLGYEFAVGPECEFYLFHADEDGLPTTITHEQASYFDLGPMDFGENARRDIVLNLEELGFSVESSHHEVAPAQHEIDFKYDEALVTADRIMTFKMTVRTIAKRHGLHATFMPKPKNDSNGSGMHLNMSLSKNGQNIFDDPSGEYGLSKEALYFIGGLMKHVKAMALITNPLINSYKRLRKENEAPVFVSWSTKNRKAMLRVPYARGSATRVELRCPDPSANPYLALAVCLQAGLDGIENQILPPASIDQNIFKMSMEELLSMGVDSMPETLEHAIEEFEKDKLMVDVLGEYVARNYIESKKREWNDYISQVGEWELNKYLLKY